MEYVSTLMVFAVSALVAGALLGIPLLIAPRRYSPAGSRPTPCRRPTEMLGMPPMGWNGIPAIGPRKEEGAFECGKRVMALVNNGITPRPLVTRLSFENTFAGVPATGGSTNSVRHLPATATEFGIKLSIDDFDRLSKKTPVRADLKPSGNYTAPEAQSQAESV